MDDKRLPKRIIYNDDITDVRKGFEHVIDKKKWHKKLNSLSKQKTQKPCNIPPYDGREARHTSLLSVFVYFLGLDRAHCSLAFLSF